jgi:diguanylate cyclase (GGDEF)-like protein
MIPATPKLADEAARLAALQRYAVLDTPEEAPFETIVTLVKQVLHVPMCAVSLIDRHRQWFKAKRGLGVCETARDISFCTHTIQTYDPLVVREAREDPRFRDNPLVTAEPHIRAYLGVPLVTPDGYNIGALCAIDTAPRAFPEAEVAILSNFGRMVVGELELRQIASLDTLTGAMSRRAWTEAATKEFARSARYGCDLSVVTLDIDHFKTVNDTWGHPAGDRVLKAVADRLMALLRISDSLGRMGGEEFSILLPETGAEGAAVIAERCRRTIADLVIENDPPLRVTSSFGVAALSADAGTLEDGLARADRALYQAKQAGRDRVHVAGAD